MLPWRLIVILIGSACALRRILADRDGLPLENIVVGNGTAELLQLCAFAFLSQNRRVFTIGPTFSEYERVSNLTGALVTTWRATAPDFNIEPVAVAEAITRANPDVVFLCNPNNPTGIITPLKDIGTWATAHPDTLFVVDEAYINFATSDITTSLAINADNLLVIRSLTKDYALAGLRLGYAVSRNTRLIAAIAALRPAWNVSGVAQAAGLAAIGDDEHLKQCLESLRCNTKHLTDSLHEKSFKVTSSTTHYFLVDVGDATVFRSRLLTRGLLVRDATSFGLPHHVRIATRLPEENARLITAISDL